MRKTLQTWARKRSARKRRRKEATTAHHGQRKPFLAAAADLIESWGFGPHQEPFGPPRIEKGAPKNYHKAASYGAWRRASVGKPPTNGARERARRLRQREKRGEA